MMQTTRPHLFDQLRTELRQISHEARWVLSTLSLDQRRKLWVAVGLMAIAAGSNAMVPLLIGSIVDSILRGQIRAFSSALSGLMALVALYVFREAVTVWRRIVVERAATDIEKASLLRAVRTTFKAELAAIAEERVGATHSRLRRSVDGVVRYVKLTFLDFVPALANALFALVAALYQQPLVGLVMILIVPVGGFIVVRQLASQRGVRLRLIHTKQTMDGTVVEQLSAMETVRAANKIDRELSRTAAVAEQLRADEMQHHKAMATFDALKSLNEGFFHVALLAIAITLNVRGIITTGDVLSFSMLFLATVTPLREIHRILDEAHESSLLVGQYREILQQPPDISFATAESPQLRPAGAVTIIAAEHVSADYKANGAVKPVLRDVSFEIRQGEIIGIAGPSGCGKSTLIRLLLRLLHPTDGSLTVCGTPIHEMSRDMIARLFGFVSQTPFLFAGTIFDNIAYECPDASEKDVRAAARLAQVADDIERMQGGYQAYVTEHGQNLSGGQRQRIALARAFLKRTPILVLDEATSALDNVSESAVLDALRLEPTRTVIMVAHRTSALQHTDRVLVFDRGSLIETGTFDHLSADGGPFSRLLRATVSSPAVALQ